MWAVPHAGHSSGEKDKRMPAPTCPILKTMMTNKVIIPGTVRDEGESEVTSQTEPRIVTKGSNVLEGTIIEEEPAR